MNPYENIIALTGTVLMLIGSIVSCFVWVSTKLEKIHQELAAIRADAKDFVTHDVCHRRRQECPCSDRGR